MAIATCSICFEQDKECKPIKGGSVCVDCAEILGAITPSPVYTVDDIEALIKRIGELGTGWEDKNDREIIRILANAEVRYKSERKEAREKERKETEAKGYMSNKTKWLIALIIGLVITFLIAYQVDVIISARNIGFLIAIFSLLFLLSRFILQIPTYERARKANEHVKSQQIIEPATPQEPETIQCSKCGSSQIQANERGFGVGRAVVGTALFGALSGAFMGGIGSKQLYITCLNCGNKWKAGKQR